MATIVVTRNYQITLPKAVRKETTIVIGDPMHIEVKGDTIIIKKVKGDPVKAAFGAWRTRCKETGVEYVDKLRSEWKDRE
jgi:AbrB family looped-hinge helix DNA binding protein